jgi:hypothetical protein
MNVNISEDARCVCVSVAQSGRRRVTCTDRGVYGRSRREAGGLCIHYSVLSSSLAGHFLI